MRKLKEEEIQLIKFMLADNLTFRYLIDDLPNKLVEEMEDGGMGSLKFLSKEGNRHFNKQIGEVNLLDIDSVPLSITLNVDQYFELFELDIFKGDFTPLKEFPKPPYNICGI